MNCIDDVAYIVHPYHKSIEDSYQVPTADIISMLETDYESVFVAVESSDNDVLTNDMMLEGVKLIGSKGTDLVDVTTGNKIVDNKDNTLFIMLSYFRLQNTNIYQCICNNKIIEATAIINSGDYHIDNWAEKDIYYTKVSGEMGSLKKEIFRFAYKDKDQIDREPKFSDNCKVLGDNIFVDGDTFDIIMTGPIQPQIFRNTRIDWIIDTNMTVTEQTEDDLIYSFTNLANINYLSLKFEDDTYFRYSSIDEDLTFNFNVYRI